MDRFVDFTSKYGIGGVIICFVAIVATQLIKYPIKDWAERKFPTRKTVVTKWLFSIPLFLCFIGSLLDIWAVEGWGASICHPDFDWSGVFALMFGCFGMSTGLYSIVEVFIKDSNTATMEKEKSGTVTAEETAEEKAQAEAEKKAKKVAKLEAKIAKLNQE